MGLKNMKVSKSRRKKGDKMLVCDPDETYPYGLTINLDSNSLDKLGIKELPKTGTEMIVIGVGVVESTHAREHQKGHTDRGVSIQLQQLEVGPKNEETAQDAVDAALGDL